MEAGIEGLRGSSDSKESTRNAGDPCSIPGLGRSPREGNSYPPQYFGLENSRAYIWSRKESDTTEQLTHINTMSSQLVSFKMTIYFPNHCRIESKPFIRKTNIMTDIIYTWNLKKRVQLYK